MKQRVFVVLAVRNGAAYLADTLAAIQAQTVQTELVVAVDAKSSDGSKATLQSSSASHLVEVQSRASFGTAVAAGVVQLPPAEEGDWLWLLAHDAYPHARALEAMLGSAETSPSVAVVGPKVMRAQDAATFAEYGETMTPFGRSVLLRGGELDQGQHDGEIDTLGVAASGVLIRRDVYDALGGFDPALPSVDAGLDLGVRARLAGHRVVLQPEAKIRRAGGAEHFSSRLVTSAGKWRIERAAQLHRRLAYAPAFITILHWMSLLPLAVLRTVWFVATKQLARISGDWLATLQSVASIGAVVRSRASIRRVRVASWRDLHGLRATWRSLREHKQRVGDGVDANARAVDERVGFVEGGGLWVFALAGVASVVMLVPLIGSSAITGGAILPLDSSIAEVWRQAFYGERDALGSTVGPADGFTIVTALLASITFWAPSLAVTLLLFLALPLSAITGWYVVRTASKHRWLPAVGATVWACAPTLATSVVDGRIGAVLAHVLLPVVIAAGMRSRYSWRATGGAALASAGVVAGAPSLIPALAVLWIATVLWQWRAPRLLLAPLPAALLVGPTVWWQSNAGRPLAALADPGVPLSYEAPLTTDVVFGQTDARLGGLVQTVTSLKLGVDAGWLALALAAVLVLVALAAPFLRLRGLLPLGVAVAGVATAVFASATQLTTNGTTLVPVWTGPGVSLAMVGLLLSATVTLTALDFRAGIPSTLITVASVAAIVPIVAVTFLNPNTLGPAPARSLPAFVEADAMVAPGVATLVITPIDDESISVSVVRGTGETLGDISTIVTTSMAITEDEQALADVAANLVASGDIDVLTPLAEWGVRYVVLVEGPVASTTLGDRAERSLDQLEVLTAIGDTSVGTLWQVDVEPGQVPERPGGAAWLLGVQLAGLVLAMLVALPSRKSARGIVTRGRLEKGWA